MEYDYEKEATGLARVIIDNGYKPKTLITLQAASDPSGVVLLGATGQYTLSRLRDKLICVSHPAVGVNIREELAIQRVRRGPERVQQTVFPTVGVGYYRQKTVWETIGADGKLIRFRYCASGRSSWNKNYNAGQAMGGILSTLHYTISDVLDSYEKDIPEDKLHVYAAKVKRAFPKEELEQYKAILDGSIDRSAFVLDDGLLKMQYLLNEPIQGRCGRDLAVWKATKAKVVALSTRIRHSAANLRLIEQILGADDNLVERVNALYCGSVLGDDPQSLVAYGVLTPLILISTCVVKPAKQNPDCTILA